MAQKLQRPALPATGTRVGVLGNSKGNSTNPSSKASSKARPGTAGVTGTGSRKNSCGSATQLAVATQQKSSKRPKSGQPTLKDLIEVNPYTNRDSLTMPLAPMRDSEKRDARTAPYDEVQKVGFTGDTLRQFMLWKERYDQMNGRDG